MTSAATAPQEAGRHVAVDSDTATGDRTYPYILRGVDPRKLRTVGNSREIHDIREQRPELVASIATHGMEPKISMINVAPDANGDLGVLVGFSRTAACVAVKEQENPDLTIDVVVHEPGTTRSDVLVVQGLENLVRKDYTQAEEADLYQQLSLEGLDDESIANALIRPVSRVQAGRTISTNPRTRAASKALPDVDLLTMASLAEFADNEDAHQRLVETLTTQPHNFGWKLSEFRKARRRRDIQTNEEQQLAERGFAIVDDRYDVPEGVARLDELCSAADDNPLDPDAHRDCPGRAVAVDVDVWEAVTITEYCVDYPAHGHRTIRSVRTATAVADLDADGVPIVDPDADGVVELHSLYENEHAEHTLTPADHSNCPGHAAYIGWDDYRSTADVMFVCTAPDTHGHVSHASLNAQPERDSAWKAAENKRTKKNNKEWREIKAARRVWLEEFFTGWRTRDKLPTRVHHWLALAPVLASDYLADAAPKHRYAVSLLNLPEPKGKDQGKDPLTLILRKKSTSATQAILIRLAQVLGACEEHFDLAYTDNADSSWRNPSQDTCFYFELLAALGYPLEHVEKLINNPELDEAMWPHLAPDTVEMAQAA